MCPLRSEALKPSDAIPFEDIISLRNQDSTFSNKLASVILLGFSSTNNLHTCTSTWSTSKFSVEVTMNQC